MVLTRKITLYPVGDKEEVKRVYDYLKDGIFNQNKAMNQYLSALYTATIQEISKEDRTELNKLYTRIATSKKGSAYSQEDIVFPTGLPTTASLGQKVRQDFQTAIKNGLLYGKVSLPTYRKDNPLLVHADYVKPMEFNKNKNGLYHEYKDMAEFDKMLMDKNFEVFIKFANNITFRLALGLPYKSEFIRKELRECFLGNYKVCGSSIQINPRGKIILNLAMDIPKKEVELDENTVCGVDLGIAIPAVCSLNNSENIKKSIGSKDDFLRVRTQLQTQYRRLQKNLATSNGGHGRTKKMKAMDRFRAKERNFVKTYNHYVSKNVVDFAVNNKAKYINMEDLKGYGDNDTNQFVLRNWSYFELQNQIEYKAKKYGIEVRKINPCFTSQVCSCCGHWEEGQRVDQAHFICKSCGAELNADFNGSRNISKSELYSDGKKEFATMLIEAKKYYGIELKEVSNNN